MKILHISDTHGKHDKLKLPQEDIDICIHSGDSTNYRLAAINIGEFEEFVDWYSKVPIPVKIYVAGNHDSTLFDMKREGERMLRDAGIDYLNHDSLTIYGTKIYGYPITPRYGDWCFMTDRSKTQKHVEAIPDDTNVLINHGMPRGVLDLVERPDYSLKGVGDGALFKRTQRLENLKLFCGGHIHSNKDIINTGLRVINGVTYSNAAMVKDGYFEDERTFFNGNILKL